MGLLRRLRYLLPGRRAAEELEMRAEFEALREFAGPRELGNLTLAAENARAVWGWTWLESLLADTRYAVRILRRQPSFTVVAVLSLALGIGANAAIYTLIDRVLWRQLPVAQPEGLYTTDTSLAMFSFERLRAVSGAVVAEMALTSGPIEREIEDTAGRVEMVTGNYFGILGVGASAGRVLTAVDSNAAVVSYAYWRKACHGAPVLGQAIHWHLHGARRRNGSYDRPARRPSRPESERELRSHLPRLLLRYRRAPAGRPRVRRARRCEGA